MPTCPYCSADIQDVQLFDLDFGPDTMGPIATANISFGGPGCITSKQSAELFEQTWCKCVTRGRRRGTSQKRTLTITGRSDNIKAAVAAALDALELTRDGEEARDPVQQHADRAFSEAIGRRRRASAMDAQVDRSASSAAAHDVDAEQHHIPLPPGMFQSDWVSHGFHPDGDWGEHDWQIDPWGDGHALETGMVAEVMLFFCLCQLSCKVPCMFAALTRPSSTSQALISFRHRTSYQNSAYSKHMRS